MIATMDPKQADAVMVGEGHAPLWQYFSRLLGKSKSTVTSYELMPSGTGKSPPTQGGRNRRFQVVRPLRDAAHRQPDTPFRSC